MTWMWNDKERLHKFIKAMQKWMEFQSADENSITEEIAGRAFTRAKENSYEIIEKFDIPDEGTAGFMQSWVELGLFAGYLTGWKDSDKVIEENPFPTGGKFLLQSGDFFITKRIDAAAKKYALEATDETFTKLFSEPVSPLVQGLSDKFTRLLKVCHESSLYAGFLSGVEDAYALRVREADPFDINSIMS